MNTVAIAELPRQVAESAFDGDVKSVLRHSAEWLRGMTRSPYAVVATVKDNMLEYSWHAGDAPDVAVKLDCFQVGGGTIFVDANGKSHSVLDNDSHSMYESGFEVAGYFIGLPLYVEDQLVGVMYLARSEDFGQFNKRELLCACAFATKVATAIDIAKSVRLDDVLPLDVWQVFGESIEQFSAYVPFERSRLDKVLTVAASELSRVEEIDAAHVYLPAPDDVLVPTNRWIHRPDEPFTFFRQATSRSAFLAGFGLPGRVAQSPQPYWIEDITADQNFPRVLDALASGVRSACAFPICVNDNVTAVVECFFTRRVDSDVELLREVEAVVEQRCANT